MTNLQGPGPDHGSLAQIKVPTQLLRLTLLAGRAPS